MFEREKDIPEGLVEEHNVYETIPADGTIIGMATKEEMKIAAELEAQHHAYNRLMDANVQLDGTSYQTLLQEFEQYEKKSMEFWRGLHKRLLIPWAWELRIDVANGPIYVSNDIGYELEEDTH
ncbi:hypothetical protein [Bacillus manliponensis]|uniref:Group-specific protein n=1 Tax=Bacillus manliponensis TaxID=574376 RepID=A0A073K2J5_9BACI|nr:hypothetical protein [Bacillus manliponensis]KEK20682.1 hypothetical protein BAMA_14840 [Bacillus manliponensis]